MSNLKNYTSTVPADRSISRIEKRLVESGARHISKVYEDDSGKLLAITFQIINPQNSIPLIFKLPAKIDAVEKVLINQYKRRLTTTQRKNVADQAERTAWKIISDWVDIQTTMIQLEQAELLEIFLPYYYNPQADQTLFEVFKGDGFKQLTAGING